MIKSLCLVHLKYPSVKLVIYGDGPLRNNLKTLVDQLSLSRYVYFKGFVGNPFNKVSMNLIYVLPSLGKGFPNSLLEAMSITVFHASQHLLPVVCLSIMHKRISC